MDYQQSPACVPFPLAAVGMTSTNMVDSRDEDDDMTASAAQHKASSYQLPALSRPRPHPQPQQSQQQQLSQSHLSARSDDAFSTHAHLRNQSFFEGVQFATRVCTSRRGESRATSRQTSYAAQSRSPLIQSQPQHTLADEEEGFLSDEDDIDFWPDESQHNHSLSECNLSVEEDADGSPRVFDEGDRIGVGMTHQNMPVQDCFSHPVDQSARRLEIVRKLGYGSYAVVYLARAVLWDPEVDGVDPEDGEAGLEFGGETVYGQEFALKCLSKHNLSDELLEVQRFEVRCHIDSILTRPAPFLNLTGSTFFTGHTPSKGTSAPQHCCYARRKSALIHCESPPFISLGAPLF